jgi:hypothetical protein
VLQPRRDQIVVTVRGLRQPPQQAVSKTSGVRPSRMTRLRIDPRSQRQRSFCAWRPHGNRRAVGIGALKYEVLFNSQTKKPRCWFRATARERLIFAGISPLHVTATAERHAPRFRALKTTAPDGFRAAGRERSKTQTLGPAEFAAKEPVGRVQHVRCVLAAARLPGASQVLPESTARTADSFSGQACWRCLGLALPCTSMCRGCDTAKALPSKSVGRQIIARRRVVHVSDWESR